MLQADRQLSPSLIAPSDGTRDGLMENLDSIVNSIIQSTNVNTAPPIADENNLSTSAIQPSYGVSWTNTAQNFPTSTLPFAAPMTMPLNNYIPTHATNTYMNAFSHPPSHIFNELYTDGKPFTGDDLASDPWVSLDQRPVMPRPHYHNNSSYMRNAKPNKQNSIQRVQKPRRKKKRGKLMAEFVAHVTLPNRIKYPRNTVLTKTWRMKNIGKCPWPYGTELVYCKGDETLSLKKRYPVRSGQAGECVEVSATIRTPVQSGRYCTYFRLQSNGKFFGPRVWVDVIVDEEMKPQHNNSDAKQ